MEAKEILTIVLGSSALCSFIQFIVTFIFSRKDRNKEIEAKIDATNESVQKLTNDFDEYKATLARTHILRFADEQRCGTIDHSIEYYKQTLQDIDTYEKYCEEHPKFENNLTKIASKYIKDEYEKLLTKGENSK